MKGKKIMAIVLRTLGLKDFNKVDGKVSFTEEEKGKLSAVFGKDFVEKFTAGLDKELAGEDADAEFEAAFEAIQAHNAVKMQEMADDFNAKMEAMTKKYDKKLEAVVAEKKNLQTDVEKLKSKNEDLNKEVEKLADESEKDNPDLEENDMKDKGKGDFKLNKKLFHNRMAEAFMKGDSTLMIMAQTQGFNFKPNNKGEMASTIDVSELKEEFEVYTGQKEFEILKLMLQDTESMKYMTSKISIREKWKATKAAITSVVQQFIAKWTPLGSSQFTPLEVVNFRHKVNLPITPDDINESWISYLYDEGVTPDQMPITKYIINELLAPKVQDDRELLLIAQGEYEELDPSAISTGDAGQVTGKSMNGYCTILRNEKASGSSSVNFYSPDEDFEDDGVNAVEWFEDFADWIEEQAPLYAKKGMNIFCPPEWKKVYSRKYRDSFPTSKNEDKEKQDIDFQNFTLIALPGMRGAGVAFATPKENFIHLKNQNEGASKIFLQVADYDVKVFAEWWEGTGFAIGELVFAYAAAQGSGSGSGS